MYDYTDGTDKIQIGNTVDSIALYTLSNGDAVIGMDSTYVHLSGVSSSVIDGTDFTYA